jgi:hypothetical protein
MGKLNNKELINLLSQTDQTNRLPRQLESRVVQVSLQGRHLNVRDVLNAQYETEHRLCSAPDQLALDRDSQRGNREADCDESRIERVSDDGVHRRQINEPSIIEE